MDAKPSFLALLKQEHVEVQDYLMKLLQMGDETAVDPRGNEELFEKMKMALMRHMKAEENVFYPALLEFDEARDAVLEAIEEHHVSDLVLKELEQLDPTSDNCEAKLKVFIELINHHIKEEESVIFPLATKLLDEDELADLEEMFRVEEEYFKSAA